MTVISRELTELELETFDGGETFNIRATVRPEVMDELQQNALQQNITTLRNRVNELGVAEPIIQQQGADRIVVQLPGVQDTAEAKRILGSTATLEYRAVDEQNDPYEAQRTGRVPPQSRLYETREGEPILLSRRLIASGDNLTSARPASISEAGSPTCASRWMRSARAGCLISPAKTSATEWPWCSSSSVPRPAWSTARKCAIPDAWRK